MTALAIILIVYGLFVFWITYAKPAKIWNMGKIQGFVSAFGERGTEIFFYIWGLAALIIGIVLLV